LINDVQNTVRRFQINKDSYDRIAGATEVVDIQRLRRNIDFALFSWELFETVEEQFTTFVREFAVPA